VAVATAPGPRRSLIGMALDAVQKRARARGRTARLATFIGDHLLTVCAMAAIDVALFREGLVTGCIALGVSLLVIDFKIQG
jgi:hypothetical protein